MTKARIELAYEVIETQSGQTIATGTSEHTILNGQGKVVRIPTGFLKLVNDGAAAGPAAP
jgi:acyl-CoA thioesterase FadM